ncbi:lysylphosphatidylglycerol synthase transmembrane domain-containing protein [Dysosmobacter sp.]|uniref:lysylphosphatidylglycerol synthase transmembrane domain-containing protein n=1 Tax=Dysosmobacter sp. TaxID=2591382 RepID=UPI002A8A5F27|nr:lysylphosphatidylglycerol synthase transmembrane domain-containing protein [Dysosmobacter sp.]MDY3282503.1 lysylphosphatidylglycerol synthase transmembrane domain-containing protein [Dysosmobacter sp.]
MNHGVGTPEGRKRRKTAAVSAATLLLLSLLVFRVFRDHAREILENIRAVSLPELLVLLAMGVAYQLLESAVCVTLVRRRLPAFSFRQAVEVTLLGVFGNVSTLSAGTIPMQSGYLRRCGLMAGGGAGIMTLEYVFHKTAVLAYTTVMLLLQGRWLGGTARGLARWLFLGYGICALIIAGLLLLCTWERVQRLALRGMDRLPDTEAWERRRRLWQANLTALYEESRQLLRDGRCLMKVLAWNAQHLCCLYSIPFLAAQMLEIPGPGFRQMQLLTGLMHLISNALPNVAGVGPVEFAFVMIFSRYMTYAQASSALILYRVATFFFPFVLSVIVFLRVQRQVLDHAAGEKYNRRCEL